MLYREGDTRERGNGSCFLYLIRQFTPAYTILCTNPAKIPHMKICVITS